MSFAHIVKPSATAKFLPTVRGYIATHFFLSRVFSRESGFFVFFVCKGLATDDKGRNKREEDADALGAVPGTEGAAGRFFFRSTGYLLTTESGRRSPVRETKLRKRRRTGLAVDGSAAAG